MPIIKSEPSFYQGDYFNTATTSPPKGGGGGIIGGGGGIEPSKNITKQLVNQIHEITKKLNKISDVVLILIALMFFYLTMILGNYSNRIKINKTAQNIIIILVSFGVLSYLATMKIEKSTNLTMYILAILTGFFTIFLIIYRNYHLKKVKT
ncbi:MAG: hypothetical protein AABY22_16610 [Nanoarchaeota archaeon]